MSVYENLAGPDSKRAALSEVLRVLKPGGRLCLADWGKPKHLGMRAAFFCVQLLDGFETTQDHVHGAIPEYIAGTGFDDVRGMYEFSTPSGTLVIWRAERPSAASRFDPGQHGQGGGGLA